MARTSRFDTTKFINAAQVGGIESYTIDEGPARGVRALCVNTGGGLRFRLLVDRGLDIDQAFMGPHSLTFLAHKGVQPPTRALDRGLDWLKGFPVGLLTSCGPTNIGSPTTDAGEELGLHGPHSNTAATLESVVQPDPRAGRLEMSITASFRYGAFYGPCIEMRRTIRSVLGQNHIDFVDEFFNAGNQSTPHAWLLHVNFGYPLVDEGAELCFDGPVEPLDTPEARDFFREGVNYKRLTGPLASRRGEASVVGYIFPKPVDRAGRTVVGIANARLPLAVAIHYSTRQFPRCTNWQHLGPHEYVTALEPTNGSVEGRDKDRANRIMDTLRAGERRTYEYRLEVIADRQGVQKLRELNRA